MRLSLLISAIFVSYSVCTFPAAVVVQLDPDITKYPQVSTYWDFSIWDLGFIWNRELDILILIHVLGQALSKVFVVQKRVELIKMCTFWLIRMHWPLRSDAKTSNVLNTTLFIAAYWLMFANVTGPHSHLRPQLAGRAARPCPLRAHQQVKVFSVRKNYQNCDRVENKQ